MIGLRRTGVKPKAARRGAMAGQGMGRCDV